MTLAVATVAVAAFAEGTLSEPSLVLTRPNETYFWRTATNASVTLAWEFPDGATSADITIAGARWSHSWNDLAVMSLVVDLPEPTNASSEDVYEMTIRFDDGTVKSERIGLVRGTGVDEGTTKLVGDSTSAAWRRVNGTAVMPLPHGTESLLVGGVAVEPDLRRSAGWYVWSDDGENESVALSLAVGGEIYTAALKPSRGLLIIVM